jgi:hypothetical protein
MRHDEEVRLALAMKSAAKLRRAEALERERERFVKEIARMRKEISAQEHWVKARQIQC